MHWPTHRPPQRAYPRSLAAWLTLLAITLAFLAPAVSRTLAFAKGESLIACPMHAAMQRSVAGDDAPRNSGVSVDACPLCVLAGGLPLPQSLAVAATLTRVDRVPMPRLTGPVPSDPTYGQPPPRGPPKLA